MTDGTEIQETMTNEESYHLDAFGFLIVRDALTADEVARCVRALDAIEPEEVTQAAAHRFPFLQLRDHPVLDRYVAEICGDGYRADGLPRLVGRGIGAAEPLIDGGDRLDWARAYRHHAGVRLCQRLEAFWALADAGPDEGGLVLIPASHNRNVDVPGDILDGSDEMGLVQQPELKAGDLVLVAGNTVRGTRAWQGRAPQRLLGWSFIADGVRPAPGQDRLQKGKSRPDWTAELTPEQRAVVHDPDPVRPLVHVVTDGKRSWVEESGEGCHPMIYSRDPQSPIDEKEFFHWDLCGHLVVKGAMDEEWLAAANAAIDANADRIGKGGSGAAGDSISLKNEGHSSGMGELWNLPAPHCEPFRKMLAHPALIARLNWMMGSGYQATQMSAFLHEKGGSGHHLHAGNCVPSVANHYEVRNGRAYCEYVNVVWQLRKVTRADGGFCVVPGTHKGRYPMPDGIRTADDDSMGMIKHVAVDAGDLLFFLSSAQTHGAYAWNGEQSRRGIFLQYRGRNLFR